MPVKVDMDVQLVVLATIVGGLLVARSVRARWRVRAAALHRLETIPRSLKLFEFRNVIVPDERGTTEIDVVLVGNTGVFVIELKEYNAWIFGSEDDEKWTARYVEDPRISFRTRFARTTAMSWRSSPG